MKIAPLLAILLAGYSARAAVLYQTGWEAAPASPAWNVGAVVPQNGWVNYNNTVGHTIVANGSQGSIITPTGSRFHKFTASADTTTPFFRLAYVDITAPFLGRPAGQNVIKASIDMFVPSSQTGVAALHGLAAYQGNDLPWGVVIDPSDRSVNIIIDGGIPDYATDSFPFDAWFNLSVTANYDNSSVSVAVNGVTVAQLTTTSALIAGGVLTDVDLFTDNYFVGAPPTRIAYSDNYLVTSEAGPAPRPVLHISPGAVGEWHISWSADFFDWILESTQDLGATVWTNEGIAPNVGGGEASVDLTEQPPGTFYRLRKH